MHDTSKETEADEAVHFGPSDELVRHIGVLIHEVVKDDPMFLEEVGPYAATTWNESKVLSDWATRLILMGVAWVQI